MMASLRHFLLLILGFVFLGCAPKVVDVASLNPSIPILQIPKISTYDPAGKYILFYEFSLKEGVLVEKSWWKMLPFRVDSMALWTTGLGHDLRRLSDNHSESIEGTLMYNAQKNGMTRLFLQRDEYIIDTRFAEEMVDAIEAYEEKMQRYDNDWRFRHLRPSLFF